MSETDAVKLFGHRKWGGNTKHIYFSLSIERKASIDVASALSAAVGGYLSKLFSLIELDKDVREKLLVSAGRAVLCKAVSKPEVYEA
jgi:hypothetical protein